MKTKNRVRSLITSTSRKLQARKPGGCREPAAPLPSALNGRELWEEQKGFWTVARNKSGETLYQNNGPTWVLSLDAGDQPACRVISQAEAALWLLGLNQQDAQALMLLAAWENETPEVFSERAILARLEGSRDDLNTAAKFRDGAEREWGLVFNSQVAALAPEGGW